MGPTFGSADVRVVLGRDGLHAALEHAGGAGLQGDVDSAQLVDGRPYCRVGQDDAAEAGGHALPVGTASALQVDGVDGLSGVVDASNSDGDGAGPAHYCGTPGVGMVPRDRSRSAWNRSISRVTW